MTLASAYLQSDLFKKQYPKAKKFKFIVNQCMQNKDKAGALLISKYLKTTLRDLGSKISSENILMFVKDQGQTMQLLAEMGLTQDEMPSFV